MSSNNFNFYSYSKTYDPCSNFLNLLDSTTVDSSKNCEDIAFNTQSSFYILTDFSSGSPYIDCYYGPSGENSMQKYSDASYNDWISGLVQCTGTTDQPCYTDLSGSPVGNGNNLSMYLSPVFSLASNTHVLTPSAENFNMLLNETNTALRRLINSRVSYLKKFYMYIDLSDDNKSVVRTRFNSNGGEDLKNQVTTDFENVESLIFQLKGEYQNLIEAIIEYNTTMQIRFKLLQILNLKIFYAEQFFNVLMNKNQGAIGELDMSEYNRSLIIFKNLIVTIIIITSIYLYFKKSD